MFIFRTFCYCYKHNIIFFFINSLYFGRAFCSPYSIKIVAGVTVSGEWS
nr:MAG TPA: hypothetical protein [Caudoviricetes sp.]